MELVIVVVVALVVVGVIVKLMASGGAPVRQYSDDELRSMSEEEWENLTKTHFQKEDTRVLKVYARQYADLRQRIAQGHPETVSALDEQSRKRSLRSEELVLEELSRRGA